MHKAEFDARWDTDFRLPLERAGFVRRGRSMGLVYIEDDWELAVLRPYGRFVEPNTAPIVFCFRHTFLRPVSSDDPKRQKDWVDYLRGGRPADISHAGPALPFQSSVPARETFEGPTFEAAARALSEWAALVKDVVLPWARRTSPKEELALLQQAATGRWDDAQWIEDYRGALEGPSP